MQTRLIVMMMSGLMVAIPRLTAVAQADTNSLTQWFPALVGVQLVPTQRTQLEMLTQQTLPQVQRLLTPEQQTQFSSAIAEGKSMREAALSLNLSMKQRLQVFNVLQTTRSQLKAILTSEQRQQLQSNMQALQQQNP